MSPDKDTAIVIKWAVSHWKMVVWFIMIIWGSAVVYDTVNTLKENQDDFLNRTEAALQEARFNHRLDLMELQVMFHHPDYYPGPVRPPSEEPE